MFLIFTPMLCITVLMIFSGFLDPHCYSIADSNSFDAESGFDESEVSAVNSNVTRWISRFIEKVCAAAIIIIGYSVLLKLHYTKSSRLLHGYLRNLKW